MRYRIAILMLAAVAGCGDFEMAKKQSSPAAATTASTGDAAYMTKSAVKEPEKESASAVDTALQWADKYSQAAEKIVQLQQENRDLLNRQQSLQDQITKLQGDQVKALNQVKEADVMLTEMRQELEKWKTNVLGFRQEMREYQQAQMTALTKILKLVGGESALMPVSATQPAATSEPSPAATTKAANP